MGQPIYPIKSEEIYRQIESRARAEKRSLVEMSLLMYMELNRDEALLEQKEKDLTFGPGDADRLDKMRKYRSRFEVLQRKIRKAHPGDIQSAQDNLRGWPNSFSSSSSIPVTKSITELARPAHEKDDVDRK